MHTNDVPPGHPDINEHDLATLRENIQALCAKNDTTQNRLEEDDLKLSSGYLSKMWKGKVRFTHAILLGICRRFKCEPIEVVNGTAFTYMLDTAPPSAESEVVRQLREERDAALERAAAAEAEVQPLREAAASLQAAREAAEARAAAAEARCAELAAEARAAFAARDQQAGEAKAAREEAARARAEVVKATANAAAAQVEERRARAALEELRRQLDQWKNWATSRDERARFLEEQLGAMQAEYALVVQNANVARQRAQHLQAQVNNGQQDAAVGGGLFGLAAGLLIAAAASDSGGSRRRRRT